MRHIDFGVPDRFRRRQQQLDRPHHDSRYNDSDFGKAFGTVQVERLVLDKIDQYMLWYSFTEKLVSIRDIAQYSASTSKARLE